MSGLPVATQQTWVSLWKNDLEVFFGKNSIAHSLPNKGFTEQSTVYIVTPPTHTHNPYMVCAVLFRSNPETVGTLYIQWAPGPGTGDPGTWGLGTHGSENLGLELAYTVHVHIVHVSLITRLECTMEWNTKFCVQKTTLLFQLLLSLSILSDIRRDHFTAVRRTEWHPWNLLNMHVTFDPKALRRMHERRPNARKSCL